METITITFEGNTVTVTDGRHTETSTFNKITYEPKQALIALAEFYGYDPAGILCFDEGFEDDADDFLQDLADEAAMEETIEIWIDSLLEATGKSNINELTTAEIRSEMEEVLGSIRNEEVLLGISEYAEDNIRQMVKYYEVLREMLNNKEVM